MPVPVWVAPLPVSLSISCASTAACRLMLPYCVSPLTLHTLQAALQDDSDAPSAQHTHGTRFIKADVSDFMWVFGGMVGMSLCVVLTLRIRQL